MFLSITETVILPVALGCILNIRFGDSDAFKSVASCMPGVAVLGLAAVVGGVTSSQGSVFFTSGIIVFVAVLLHNAVGYLLGYGAGRLFRFNTAKKRTISLEVGMQNAGLATNLVTTSAQFAAIPQAAVICAVSCVWHSISGTILAGFFAHLDERRGVVQDAAAPAAELKKEAA